MADKTPDAPDEGAAARLEQQIQDAAFAAPAVYSNRVFVTLSPQFGRLSFVEMRAGSSIPVPRATVIMGITELVSLRDVLNSLLTDESLATLPLKAADDGDEQ